MLASAAMYWFWNELRVVATHAWLVAVERHLQPDDERRAVALLRYGKAMVEAGRAAEAEPVLLRGLELRERMDDTRSPPLREFYMALNQAYGQMGQYEKSSFYFRKTMSHLFESHEQAMRTTGGLGGELVRISYEIRKLNPEALPGLELSFNGAQTSLANRASRAISRMSERAALKDPALMALEKESQDISEEQQRLVLLSERKDPALVARVSELSARQSQISARLRREFPNDAVLKDRSADGIPQLQEALAPDEVLVFFFDMPPKAKGAGWTYYWAFSKTESRWDRIGIGAEALGKLAAALRCGLDEAAWRGSGEERCQALLGTEFTLDWYDRGEGLPFDLGKAHALYSALFSGIEDLIKGKHLIIVPPSVLSQVPAQVLVTRAPDASLDSAQALKTASWLGTQQAITVVPSVGAFMTLRSRTATSRAPHSYLGIGDPQLDGVPACPKITVPTDCPGLSPRTVTMSENLERGRGHRSAPQEPSVAAFSSKERTDVAALRRICPLPDTSFELRCVAESLNAPVESLLIGEKATESQVKRMSVAGELARYRVVHFATHGLLASETELFAQDIDPALILTPPEQPSESDDGLLTASEIAGLRLDADFVILSACNTAAADGNSREALSGLARAFFYAGARSILVSHWEVISVAAVKLVTRAFGELTAAERGGHPIGRAEAMRRSMADVVAEGGLAAHPAYWGAFSLVGDGSSPLN